MWYLPGDPCDQAPRKTLSLACATLPQSPAAQTLNMWIWWFGNTIEKLGSQSQIDETYSPSVTSLGNTVSPSRARLSCWLAICTHERDWFNSSHLRTSLVFGTLDSPCPVSRLLVRPKVTRGRHTTTPASPRPARATDGVFSVSGRWWSKFRHRRQKKIEYEVVECARRTRNRTSVPP